MSYNSLEYIVLRTFILRLCPVSFGLEKKKSKIWVFGNFTNTYKSAKFEKDLTSGLGVIIIKLIADLH